MAVDPKVRQARGVFAVTFGVAVTSGDLVYFNGTNWLLADADDNTKFAEAVAINTLASGEVGAACRSCVIVDDDAPFTQGNTHYLSATAGANTATRPTGARNLMQVVGYALSTSELAVEIGMVKEVAFTVPFVCATDELSYLAIQSNDFGGTNLIDNSSEIWGNYMVPQNVVGIVIQYLAWIAGSTALDGSDTYTIDTSAGIDDDATNLLSDGIAAAALTVDADNINTIDVSAAFDVASQNKPGNWVTINVAKAAEGTAGDDPGMLGCHVVLLGV